MFIKKSTDTVYSLHLKNDLDNARKIAFYCGLFVIFLLVIISYSNSLKYSFISKRVEMSMWVVIFATISYIAFNYFWGNSEKTNEENAVQVAKFDEDIREYYPQIEQTADQIAYIRGLEIRAIDYANSSYYGDIEEIISNSFNSLYASSKELRILRRNAETMSELHVAMKSPTYCKHDKEDRKLHQHPSQLVVDAPSPPFRAEQPVACRHEVKAGKDHDSQHHHAINQTIKETFIYHFANYH